ncbi:hypothetical protein BgiMline_020658 [Biomphalaria glabrata]|nr:hypothetical protein BgiMline_017850 [Biomphalaria glabrata]
MVFQSFQLNILVTQQHISSYITGIIKNQYDHPEEHVRGVILRKERLLAEKLIPDIELLLTRIRSRQTH